MKTAFRSWAVLAALACALVAIPAAKRVQRISAEKLRELPVTELGAPGDSALHFRGHPGPVETQIDGVDPRDPDSGAELIGTPAPRWTFDRWLRTQPLSLEQLRGKVVLVRWWTEGCQFCTATLPVLERLRERDAAKGLVVIGVFHPKPPRAVSDQHVLAAAAKIGFDGPLAIDSHWQTLNRYWLDANPERNWTSVSFLIDKRGIIRWVHGGGEYHPSSDPAHHRCDLEYRGLERALATALAQSQVSDRSQ